MTHIFTQKLPDRDEILHVVRNDNTFTLTVNYTGYARTRGDTQVEAVDAMANLLQDEINLDHLRQAFADPIERGVVATLKIAGRNGRRGRSCSVGAPESLYTKTRWFAFVRMGGLSVSASTYDEAVSKLRQLADTIRVDADFMARLVEAIADLNHVVPSVWWGGY